MFLNIMFILLLVKKIILIFLKFLNLMINRSIQIQKILLKQLILHSFLQEVVLQLQISYVPHDMEILRTIR